TTTIKCFVPRSLAPVLYLSSQRGEAAATLQKLEKWFRSGKSTCPRGALSDFAAAQAPFGDPSSAESLSRELAAQDRSLLYTALALRSALHQNQRGTDWALARIDALSPRAAPSAPGVFARTRIGMALSLKGLPAMYAFDEARARAGNIK